MKTKLAIAIATGLASASIAVSAATTVSKPSLAKESFPAAPEKTSIVSNGNIQKAVFIPEENLAKGKYRYFVRLTESPVALYQGGIENLKATQVKHGKLNTKDKSVKAYRSFLNKQQDTVINKATALIGKLDIKQQTTLAYNGMVVEMTQEEAIQLASIPGIAHIHRETLRYPTTDVGPQFIKADKVWDGTATGTESKGAGIVVGVIDTGINHDNPAFADVGADGYDHTNPWGEGVYSGDCATEEWASLCNDKLIGVHSYPLLTDNYDDYDPDVAKNGEDHNGHGSHVAGTAAGNVLQQVEGPAGVMFDQISGVAPHANIVSYQVCLPGERDAINFRGCFPSLTVLSVEHAIEAGVDVLNYSVGGGSSDPWQDPDALAFLAARQAGIHVATSAGNSGPSAGTVGSPGDAPWITSVAAATHDRTLDRVLSFNNESYSFSLSSAPAFSETVTGPLVYSGDISEANVEGCEPFAENSFANSVAFISRGTCAFADKVTHATQAGAAAVIVHNNRDGDATVNMSGLEEATVPAVMVSENSANSILASLASAADKTVSIVPNLQPVKTTGGAIAEFSSRGANASVPDIIAPSISAPGVSIFAPYADDQSAGFKENPDPADFAFLSGTSMASPHMAGALAILADIQPEWSPAALQSAVMLTANQNTLSHDGSPATFFDMGAGMANLELAAQSGLVLEESFNGYMSANPNVGGKPSNINLPTLANASCVGTCTWTRTVTATKSGEWQATSELISEGVTLTVAPESFSLSAGQTQTITVTAEIAENVDGWNFANVLLKSSGTPDARLPVAVKAEGDNLPASIDVVATRDNSNILLPGFESADMSDLEIAAYNKISHLVEPVTLSVPESGFDFFAVTFDEAVQNIKISTTASTAPDVDLRVLNSSFVTLGSSAGPTQFETLSFNDLPAGTYYIVVDGYRASTAGGTDPVTVEVTSILFNEESQSENLTAEVFENNTGFDIKLSWLEAAAESGYLAITSTTSDMVRAVPYSLSKGESDVKVSVSAALEAGGEIDAGIANTLTFNIAPNFETVDKVYTLSATVTGGHELTNISNDGTVEGGVASWTITRKAGESSEYLPVTVDLIGRKASTGNTLTLSSDLNGDTVEQSLEFDVAEAAPVADIDALAKVREGQLVELDGSVSYDPNGDAITYQWTQRGGAPVSFGSTHQKPTFVAPGIGEYGEVMSFDLVVTDANGNTDKTSVSFIVLGKGSSGGSMGYLVLTLLPLLALRRRKK